VELATAKCLYTIFGVELERGISDNDWGGIAAARVERSSMDTNTAIQVFRHVAGELREALEWQGDETSARNPSKCLVRHRALLERLLRAFPRPPAQVCSVDRYLRARCVL
jgi:hypothetical protein